jgi:putative chitinase
VVVAALATIAVECDFIPQAESSDGKAYEGRVDLGNTQPGDGVRYIGRGLPQLTGRHNYEQYGEWCGYDLVNHPELLDDLAVSCAVFACFFKCSRCAELANEGFWQAVRRTYNGGSNGMARFIQCVGALLPLAEFAYKGEV